LCRSESILEYLADALGKFKGADRRGGRLRSRGFPDVSAWMRRGGFGTPEQVPAEGIAGVTRPTSRVQA
jgi:hypothetical protein